MAKDLSESPISGRRPAPRATPPGKHPKDHLPRIGMGPTYERIYAVVVRIPRGRVATYGQIAELAGFPRQPRLTGYALNALPGFRQVPWHRVINARGGISPRAEPGIEQVQRKLLEREGVQFGPGEVVALARYKWRPRGGRVPVGRSRRTALKRGRRRDV